MKLTDTLLAALVNEDKVAIVSVKVEPGVGGCHLIKEFAKSEELSLIDIRTACLAPYDFMDTFNKPLDSAIISGGGTAFVNMFEESDAPPLTTITMTDGHLDSPKNTEALENEMIKNLGYPPIRHHLMSDEPVVILIDEVSDHTSDMVQRLITQIHEQARSKVLVVLVGLRSEGELPEALKQKFPIIEAEPIDGAEFFVEFLREQKKSDVHLKVADFVEENGLSGANPHQWQLFALTQNMGLEHAAACGLGDIDLAKRFVEWQPGQGKTAK